MGSKKIAIMPQHSIMFMIIQAYRAPQGPMAAEARERIGTAHLRHSFYARAQEAQKDVKNADRPDYVYENTGEFTKGILEKCPFLHESAPNE